jgi:integrase
MSIRKHGRTFQVRLPGERARSFPTHAAAEKYELNRKLARSLGDLHAEPPVTITEMLDGYLHRWQTREHPAPGTVDRARDALRFLHREFGGLLLPQLGLVQVEDAIIDRAVEHPNAAKKELEWLKRGLRDARRRGQRFDLALLMIDPIRVASRQGVALDVDQLDRLASWFPEHLAAMAPFMGSVGTRIGETLTLTDDRVDVKRGSIFIPAAQCKENRDKLIELTEDERQLLAEQLLARPTGTPFVFPRLGGGRHHAGPYDDHSYFYEKVWHPARKGAAMEWRQERGLPHGAATVFDRLVPHDLRHTAISLMAAGGMRPETVAARVGHKDGGKLILDRYRHLFPDEMRVHLDRYETYLRDRRDTKRQEAGEAAR